MKNKDCKTTIQERLANVPEIDFFPEITKTRKAFNKIVAKCDKKYRNFKSLINRIKSGKGLKPLL